MSDQDNLRERIADAIYKNQDTAVGYASELFGDAAQAIIDELELTVRGDDCGYHEIHGSYDTRFEAKQ